MVNHDESTLTDLYMGEKGQFFLTVKLQLINVYLSISAIKKSAHNNLKQHKCSSLEV